MEILTDNLFKETNEPTTQLSVVHRIRVEPPREAGLGIGIGVIVDETGYLAIDYAHGFGDIAFNNSRKGSLQEAHANRMEVYSYLVEWELAAWQRIGPEDSEIFATKKLDPEWGIG